MQVNGNQAAALDHYQNWGVNANEDQTRLQSRWNVFQQSGGRDLKTLKVEVQTEAQVSEEVYARRQQIWNNSQVKRQFDNKFSTLEPKVRKLYRDVIFGLRPVRQGEIRTFHNAVELCRRSHHAPERLSYMAEEDLEYHLGRAIRITLANSRDPEGGENTPQGRWIKDLLAVRFEAHRHLNMLQDIQSPEAWHDAQIIGTIDSRVLQSMREIARSRDDVAMVNRITEVGEASGDF